MHFIDWLAVVASLATIVSLIINLFQWRFSEKIKNAFYSNVLSEWNLMQRIAELADQSRNLFRDTTKTDAEKLQLIIRNFDQATGIADSSRLQLRPLSEHFLKKPIVYQHAAEITQIPIPNKWGFLSHLLQKKDDKSMAIFQKAGKY